MTGGMQTFEWMNESQSEIINRIGTLKQ
jgi:hypothetical protein